MNESYITLKDFLNHYKSNKTMTLTFFLLTMVFFVSFFNYRLTNALQAQKTATRENNPQVTISPLLLPFTKVKLKEILNNASSKFNKTSKGYTGKYNIKNNNEIFLKIKCKGNCKAIKNRQILFENIVITELSKEKDQLIKSFHKEIAKYNENLLVQNVKPFKFNTGNKIVETTHQASQTLLIIKFFLLSLFLSITTSFIIPLLLIEGKSAYRSK
jgi:hypothetical protein